MATWRESGEIIDANDAFANMVGYSGEEFTAQQRSWKAMTPQEYIERDQMGIEEVKKKGFCTPYEKVFIHRDGHLIPIIICNGTFDRESQVGVFFVLDLTTRKQAEEELHKSEQRFKALAISGFSVVYRMNSDWSEMQLVDVDLSFLVRLYLKE